MKSSHRFFLIGASLFFFWILGGFNPYLSWEQRLIKIAIVGIFATVAWLLKNSSKKNRRKTGLIVLLIAASATVYAEPYINHWLSNPSHFSYIFTDGNNHYHKSKCD
jgi:chromate transport protein ChrA